MDGRTTHGPSSDMTCPWWDGETTSLPWQTSSQLNCLNCLKCLFRPAWMWPWEFRESRRWAGHFSRIQQSHIGIMDRHDPFSSIWMILFWEDGSPFYYPQNMYIDGTATMLFDASVSITVIQTPSRHTQLHNIYTDIIYTVTYTKTRMYMDICI